MCRPTTCNTCQNTTWAGCGQHVEFVKATVHPDDWCNGSHTPAEIAAARAERPSFLSRIFGR